MNKLNRSKCMLEANIETTDIKTSPGVTLDPTQKTLVGCVLDVRVKARENSPYD